jgi:elongation factor P--(R)-beta-lysine ligase
LNTFNIVNRNKIIAIIRDFFNSRGYLEVETPLLSPALIPETAIEIFETTHVNPFKSPKKAYLIPSPEVWLKRFISQNPINVFEISKCFRNSEQSGRHHNPEFTMIEYYTMGYTEKETLELTKALLDTINNNYPSSALSREHLDMTMNEAFINYAGFSLEENLDIEQLHKKARELDIPISPEDTWEEAFNRIFVDVVEPNLPRDKNLFLTNFPSNIKTLATNIEGTPWANRWELYINGIECGNCYNEERNPGVVRDFFINETREKNSSAMVPHNTDPQYYQIFENFPKCSGGAIGLDRLIMGILGIQEIKGVILFPYHDNIY